MTEQDRALASKRGRRRTGFGKNPALLFVDLYRAVYGDKPEPLLESIKTWPASCGMAGWNALPDTKNLLDTARRVGIPIIHATHALTIEDGIPPWNERGRGEKYRRREIDGSNPGTQDERMQFEIIDELKPVPGEVVVRKSSPSAFWGTPLVSHLISLGIDTLITAGETTSGCVRASVVDGRTLGYRMIVVEDCVFDRTEASHAINLFDMDQKYADVVPLSDATTYLLSWQSATSTGLSRPEVRPQMQI